MKSPEKKKRKTNTQVKAALSNLDTFLHNVKMFDECYQLKQLQTCLPVLASLSLKAHIYPLKQALYYIMRCSVSYAFSFSPLSGGSILPPL